jgi:hypothetical protein
MWPEQLTTYGEALFPYICFSSLGSVYVQFDLIWPSGEWKGHPIRKNSREVWFDPFING